MSKFNTCPFSNDVECTYVNIYMYFDILVENLVKFLKVSIRYSPPCMYGQYFFKYGKVVHESTIGQNFMKFRHSQQIFHLKSLAFLIMLLQFS